MDSALQYKDFHDQIKFNNEDLEDVLYAMGRFNHKIDPAKHTKNKILDKLTELMDLEKVNYDVASERWDVKPSNPEVSVHKSR